MVDAEGSKVDIDLTASGVLGFGTVAKESKLCFSIPFNYDPELNEVEVQPYFRII